MSVTGLLVNSTIKISLIILLVLAVMRLMRSRSAALRHWMLAVVVGCAAAMPVLDAIRPSSTWSMRLTSGADQTAGQVPPVTQARTSSAAPVPIRYDASVDRTDVSNFFM